MKPQVIAERWRDGQLKTLPKLLELIKLENRLQIQRHGVRTHTVSVWAAILQEEVGELAKEMCQRIFDRDSPRLSQIGAEAIQVATLALKIAEMAGKAGP